MKNPPQKAIIPFRCEDLFNLVADVKRYPEFLPWCTEAIIHKDTPEEMLADLCIGYGMMTETFRSHVHLKPFESISVECVKGPLNKLTNHWTFRPLSENETEIEFAIDYKFKNPLFQMGMDAIYPKAFAKMTEAFEKRAQEIYGMEKAG